MSIFKKNYSVKIDFSHVRAAGFLLASILMVFTGFTSCVSGPKSNGGFNGDQISFETNEEGELIINNASGCDLVILAGNTGVFPKDKVLGGIRAGSTRAFGCPQAAKSNAGAFFLNALKFEDYKNKGIVSPADVVFSKLVLPDCSEITITEHAGGKEYFFVDNTSNCLLQLHINSPNGELLTSIMPFSSGKKIYFEPAPRGLVLFCSYIAWDGKDLGNLKTYQDGNPIIIRYGADTVYQFTQPKTLENMGFHVN